MKVFFLLLFHDDEIRMSGCVYLGHGSVKWPKLCWNNSTVFSPKQGLCMHNARCIVAYIFSFHSKSCDIGNCFWNGVLRWPDLLTTEHSCWMANGSSLLANWVAQYVCDKWSFRHLNLKPCVSRPHQCFGVFSHVPMTTETWPSKARGALFVLRGLPLWHITSASSRGFEYSWSVTGHYIIRFSPL